MDDEAHASTNQATAFNNMRALIQFLHLDLGYLSEDQLKYAEYLIDRNNVAMGAIFEVYSVTEDIEDLTHSIIVTLKGNDLISKDDPDPVVFF